MPSASHSHATLGFAGLRLSARSLRSLSARFAFAFSTALRALSALLWLHASRRGLGPRVYSPCGQGSHIFGHGLRGEGGSGGGAGGGAAPGASPETGQGPLLGVAGREARAGRDDTGVRGSRARGGDRAYGTLLGGTLCWRVPARGAAYDRCRREDGVNRGCRRGPRDRSRGRAGRRADLEGGPMGKHRRTAG